MPISAESHVVGKPLKLTLYNKITLLFHFHFKRWQNSKALFVMTHNPREKRKNIFRKVDL